MFWQFKHLGFNPATGERYPVDVRWPGVLRNELGDDYRVIEEGLTEERLSRVTRYMVFQTAKPISVPPSQTTAPWISLS